MRQTGDLKERVMLLRRSDDTQNGESYEAWEPIFPDGVWAEVYAQSDKAFAAGDARYQQAVKFCTLRKPLGLKLGAGLRFIHEGQAYNVEEVVPGPLRGTVKLRGVMVDMRGSGVVETWT